MALVLFNFEADKAKLLQLILLFGVNITLGDDIEGLSFTISLFLQFCSSFSSTIPQLEFLFFDLPNSLDILDLNGLDLNKLVDKDDTLKIDALLFKSDCSKLFLFLFNPIWFLLYFNK